MRFLRRLLSLFTHRHDEADLAREMSSHLSMLEASYQQRGMSADDARVAARRAMGSMALAKDLHRDARSFGWVEDLVRNVRLALAAVFAVVALVAAIVPARRALQISPSLALRAE